MESEINKLKKRAIEEIKISNEENIPVFGIYEQNKNYYVPAGLGNRFISWTWNNLTFPSSHFSGFSPE